MRVLVLATSPETRGGITSVLNCYKKQPVWKEFACRWISTHRDGSKLRKLAYLISAWGQFICLLPFYDIVHIHVGLRPSMLRKYPFFLLARALRKKTVVHLHCGSQLDSIWNRRYSKVFTRADRVLVLSESIREDVLARIGEDYSGKVTVLYNPAGQSPASFEKRQSRILFAGLLVPEKGCFDLIKAFARLAGGFPGWRLVLAGDGRKEDCRLLAERLGVGDAVELPGWVDAGEMGRLYSESSIFCLPSYAEGLPMSILEAWSNGLPVVCTPVGAVPEIAEDGGNAMFVSPGDPDALAGRLSSLMSDRKLREDMAGRALESARAKFSPEAICLKLSEIYKNL